jgi:hypothetical protein
MTPNLVNEITVRVEARMDLVHAQLEEARQLLEHAPESVHGHLVDALLKSLASLSFETHVGSDFTALPAGEGLFVISPVLPAEFERLVAAMRAGQFDFA